MSNPDEGFTPVHRNKRQRTVKASREGPMSFVTYSSNPRKPRTGINVVRSCINELKWSIGSSQSPASVSQFLENLCKAWNRPRSEEAPHFEAELLLPLGSPDARGRVHLEGLGYLHVDFSGELTFASDPNLDPALGVEPLL